MYRTNERSLGEIIKEVLRQHRLEDKLVETRIAGSWENIMGTHIQRYTERIVLKGSTLTVYLRSSVLRNELTLAKTKIVRMINKELGKEVVRELHIR